MATELSKLLDRALQHIPDAKSALPQEAFHFVSQLTPLINVDLLIKDANGRTLLTWRHDRFHGPAWHIPGGIIRFKENIEDRILKVAEAEIGCPVRFEPKPIDVRGMINKTRDVRGHFISLLYVCALDGEPDLSRKCNSATPAPGEWSWHIKAPPNLLGVHEPFRIFIDETPPL